MTPLVDTDTGETHNPTATDQLAKALAAFQGEMPTVPKNRTATIPGKDGRAGYSYTYADLADLTEAAMPVLSKHGLAFVSLPSNGLLTGMLLHTSGQSLSASLPINGSTPQQIGSSLTYMRRYLLGCITGLVTDADDDGQQAERAAKKKPAKATQPPAAPVRMSRPRSHKEDPNPVAPPEESPYLNTASPLAKAMFAALNDLGITDKADRLAYVSGILRRDITSSTEMTDAEAARVLEAAQADLEQPFPLEEPPP